MAIPQVGQPAPVFETVDESGNPVRLADYIGKRPVALVFYPKDDTPGWTKQLCSLRDSKTQIDQHQVACFGISYDPAESHVAFRDKFGLTTPLLIDTDKKIGAAYGLSQGEYADRKTFVIQSDGRIAGVIEQVDFDNHASQILATLGIKS